MTKTIIDHLYAARNSIKRNLYEKAGGGSDRIGVWLHPSSMTSVMREVRADMFEATIAPKGALKLFAMDVKQDRDIPEGVAHLALNGTHVLTVDLSTGVIAQMDHALPVSEDECAVLDSFFRDRKTVRVERLAMDVAMLKPLSLRVDDEAPISIPVRTLFMDELAERGLVRVESHAHGYDVSLTWKGRMTLNNYRALT